MFTFTPKELFSKLLKNFFGQLFPPSLFFLSLSLFHLTHSLSFFLCLSDTSTNVKLTTNIFSLVLALARSLTLNTFAIVDSLSLSLSPSLSCSHTHPVEPQTFILPTYLQHFCLCELQKMFFYSRNRHLLSLPMYHYISPLSSASY